ncbi:MAG: hypothetical protein ABI823_13140 [Bryobacteraceae bacterium]
MFHLTDKPGDPNQGQGQGQPQQGFSAPPPQSNNPFTSPPRNVSSYDPPPTGGSGLKIPILFGAVLALVASNVYLFLQLKEVKTELVANREAVLEEVAKVRETSTVTTQTQRRNVEQLREQLAKERAALASLSGQAKEQAMKHADELAAKLERAQTAQGVKLSGEITQAKEANAVTAAKVGEVTTEVGTVKSDVAATKSELEKTISDLKRTSGDLGVQSGLIATNGKELAALKALGERNIFDIKLAKTKAPQKIGDISVLLKKADPKKNRYTIEIVADDKRVEKKDKTVNEPLQFYTSKARQPYEIVVNEVKKDYIGGYLATPKVQAVRN